jgi:YHS domain-containing protein
MTVVIEGAQHVSEYEGTTYYFCGKGCRLEFEDDPERILAPGYVPSM